MPFGEHWEWRGFGRTSPAFRAWFQTLPPYYPPSEAPLRDEYLWTPSCAHNVKLRYDALKFKRFIARQGAFERWLEAPDEFLPFPLHPDHLRQVEALLNVRLPAIPARPIDRDAFLELIARAQPPVHRVTVIKQRRLSRWRAVSGEEIIVEWTHILQPRAEETVAMEHESLAALQQAHARIAPRLAGLLAMNYLQAIGRWLSEGSDADADHAATGESENRRYEQ